VFLKKEDGNITSLSIPKNGHGTSQLTRVSLSSPSLDLRKDLAPYFDVDEQMINHALIIIGLALKGWKGAAKKNQLEAEEIKRFQSAFVHDDSEKLIALVGKNRKSLTL